MASRGPVHAEALPRCTDDQNDARRRQKLSSRGHIMDLHHRFPTRRNLFAAALGVISASPAGAQRVRGNVLAEFTDQPVAGASVYLLTQDGGGTFITRDQIEQRHPFEVSDLLRTVPD
jgi:hypothetical protein